METANDISYMMIDDNMVYDDDVDIIDVPVGDVDVDVYGLGDVGIVGGLEDETRENGEKREKHEKENDKSKLEIKTEVKEIVCSCFVVECVLKERKMCRYKDACKKGIDRKI